MWGGDEDCEHVWGNEIENKRGNGGERDYGSYDNGTGRGPAPVLPASQFCQQCNAWRGNLGLEPTPQLFVEHLVEVMRGVWRVLRDDGLLFLNLGDSYATGGGKVGNCPGGGKQGEDWKTRGQMTPPNRMPLPGLKPKDLCGIPWRVALALQADGWYLRSAMPWVKSNCMPESVRDRPTTAHEYVFMFSKSKRYFYDQETVRVAYSPTSHPNSASGFVQFDVGAKHKNKSAKINGLDLSYRASANTQPNPSGRNRRTSDTFNESLDLRIEQQRAYLAHLEHVRDNGGMLLSEDGMPAALMVNTASYKGAHFATFPLKLVQPLIACGTSERGCCPECGASWVRVVEKKGEYTTQWGSNLNIEKLESDPQKRGKNHQSAKEKMMIAIRTTTGWQPTCTCNAGDPIPCTVFDPFGGSGTSAVQADRMNRNAVIVELNETYATDLAYERIAGDAPMFADVEIMRCG